MSKNYRLRTTPGIDKNIRIKIDQDFDFIEILSLKLKQSDLYTRFCADYGVIAGRVITNGGYGVPNVNVSVFVPLSNEDDEDPVISTLYPYKTLTDKNEDGYRYNLLFDPWTFGGLGGGGFGGPGGFAQMGMSGSYFMMPAKAAAQTLKTRLTSNER